MTPLVLHIDFELEEFERLELNGELIPDNQYGLEQGSTIITIAANTLADKPSGTQLLPAPKFTKAQKSLAAKADTANKKAVAKVAKAAKKAKVGKKLTVSAKAIKGFKATYQWYRNGKAIPKATKKTYKLTKADKGKKITLKVSYTTTKKATKTDDKKATAQYKPTKTYTYTIGKIKK
jgi:hypothetical protein